MYGIRTIYFQCPFTDKLHVSVTFILLLHACRLSYMMQGTLCVLEVSRGKREKALNVHESECLSAKERVALA